MTRLFLASLLLIAAFGELAHSAVPSCKADQIAMDGRPTVWHITLSDAAGHRFVVIQTKNSLETALNTCSKWLKAQTKKPKK